jgi:hypothetical protein
LPEPKKDPPLEIRRGKCNQASREPKRALIATKIAFEYILRLIYRVISRAVECHLWLKLAHL